MGPLDTVQHFLSGRPTRTGVQLMGGFNTDSSTKPTYSCVQDCVGRKREKRALDDTSGHGVGEEKWPFAFSLLCAPIQG